MKSVDMSKRGAFLHTKHNGRKGGAHGNVKKEKSRKACRGKFRA